MAHFALYVNAPEFSIPWTIFSALSNQPIFSLINILLTDEITFAINPASLSILATPRETMPITVVAANIIAVPIILIISDLDRLIRAIMITMNLIWGLALASSCGIIKAVKSEECLFLERLIFHIRFRY
jgi:hypothetical protein